MQQEIYLFDNPSLLPKEVQMILLSAGDDQTYENCEKLLNKLKPLGYTFEYYLDAVPFNLKKI